MPRSPRIAVIGSANTDLTTFSDTFPRPGETIFGTRFDLGFGGKGANQAVAARLCGADVVMIAKVGNDLFGEATIKNFAAFGIDTTHVGIVDGVSSGVAPIFVEPNGQNRIIVVKGANDTLKPADVDVAAETLRSVDTIILQFEIPLETVYYAVQFARKNQIRCIVNPAPALPAKLSELAVADYFVPNETEAEAIAGLPVHSLDDAKKCAAALLQKEVFQCSWRKDCRSGKRWRARVFTPRFRRWGLARRSRFLRVLSLQMNGAAAAETSAPGKARGGRNDGHERIFCKLLSDVLSKISMRPIAV